MLTMTQGCYNSIIKALALTPPETGGILGAENGVITHFEFDSSIKSTMHYYEPDAEKLNNVIKEWHNNNICFYGVIHSHPLGNTRLSQSDIEYARRLITASRDKICMFIVDTDTSSFSLTAYIVTATRVKKIPLAVISFS